MATATVTVTMTIIIIIIIIIVVVKSFVKVVSNERSTTTDFNSRG
jgi:hypothetical protein